MTQVTEPPPSSGQEDYNPFAEEGKPKKKEEPEVRGERRERRGRKEAGKEGGRKYNSVGQGLGLGRHGCL